MGLRNDATVERFIAWWSRRCYDKCIDDVRQGLFVDQRWLDLVPGLFDGVHILRHAGYNVGHWGLTHRRVEAHEGGMRVNGSRWPFSISAVSTWRGRRSSRSTRTGSRSTTCRR